VSAARPKKAYAWAPTWQPGRVLGWLLIAVAGFSIVDVLVELDRAFSATTIIASGSGAGWSYASPIAFVTGPIVFACEILWLIWHHRVTEDLWARGVPGLRFTPGWAVGWWFVPFAWWVQPFRAVRELWHLAGRSGRDAAPAVPDGVLAAWWTTYVGSQLVAIPLVVIPIRVMEPLFSHLGETPLPTITFQASDLRAIATWAFVGGVVRIASALLATRIVWSISEAEDGAMTLSAPPPRPDL
jgi:Domain of unknown function (DUF4328)